MPVFFGMRYIIMNITKTNQKLDIVTLDFKEPFVCGILRCVRGRTTSVPERSRSAQIVNCSQRLGFFWKWLCS